MFSIATSPALAGLIPCQHEVSPSFTRILAPITLVPWIVSCVAPAAAIRTRAEEVLFFLEVLGDTRHSFVVIF